MKRFRKLSVGAALLGSALLFAACSSSPAVGGGGDDGEFTPPSQVRAVVHTGPGGGGDLLAREVISMLENEKLIEPNSWIVENAEGGSSAVALSTMNSYEGHDDVVAFISNIWMTNKLLTEGVEFSTLDFTPVSTLVSDKYVVVVAADSPYEDLEDIVEAAKETDGKLVQVAGSATAIDAQMGWILQDEAGVTWQTLPFASGGERKTALQRGDGQLWLTEPGDVLEDVEAGTFRVIATIGDERSPAFPDVLTSVEQGFTDEQPVMLRGVLAPKGISDEALGYYAGLMADLQETDSWKKYTERNATISVTAGPDEYREMLEEQLVSFTDFYDGLGLLVG